MDVTVLGLGLIGGSVLRALAAAGLRVTGYDADPATRAAAHTLGTAVGVGTGTSVGVGTGVGSGAGVGSGVGAGAGPRAAGPTAPGRAGGTHRWRVADTVRDAVADAGLVIIAVPLPAVAGVLDDLVDAGYRGLVTDVTSVKAPVRDLVDRRRPAAGGPLARFVGGHPMAGRETSGFAAADPALFRDCAWVLCLEPGRTALPDWLELAALVTGLGARVVPATAAEHDRAVAGISHVPHLLASALAATAATDPLAAALAAGSFRDGTRVAANPPALTAAMCGGNARAVEAALGAVLDALHQARDALRGADPADALRSWLVPGAVARAGWPPRPCPGRQLPVEVDALLALGRAGGWVTAVADDRRTVTAVKPTAAG